MLWPTLIRKFEDCSHESAFGAAAWYSKTAPVNAGLWRLSGFANKTCHAALTKNYPDPAVGMGR